MCGCKGCKGCKGGKCGGICPVTFGLALGLTSGIAVLLWSAWVMYYGMPPMMAGHPEMIITWSSSLVHAGWAVLKGFAFGFVLTLIYDCLLCCKKKVCCKTEDNKTCGCSCKPSDKI